jgi:hypothetical protein
MAHAHRNHLILLVSVTGVYYIFTAPDGKLYFGGKTLCELMERVLPGIDYGKPIERD